MYTYNINTIIINQLHAGQYTLAVTNLINSGYPRTAMHFARKYGLDSQLLNWLVFGDLMAGRW